MATGKKKGKSASKKSTKKSSKKSTKKGSKKTTKKSSKKSTSKSATKRGSKKTTKKAKDSKKPEKTPEPADDSPGKGPGRGLAIAVVVAIIALVALAAFLLQARDSTPADPVVVSVNGQPITLSEVQLAYERLPAELQATYTPEIILNQTIDKVVLLQYARTEGIEVTDEEVDQQIEQQAAALGASSDQIRTALEQSNITWSEFEEAIREEIILQRLIEDVVVQRVEISDAQVRAYYQQNIDDYTAEPGESRIRHILVENESVAMDLYERAVDGEDFATLAEANSIGPTAPDGGSLGFISNESSLVEPFKQEALQLEVGEVSEPVQTQFGWHVIYRDTDVIPLAEARNDISETLSQQEARTAFEELLAELRAEAEIRHHMELDGTQLTTAEALG